jgi:cyclic pyranopterin monophosphate synthase
MDDLTHLDAAGHARMVDVSDREVTVRTATAVGLVVTTPEVLNAIATGSVAKGDVAALARVAGILGAKRTPDLVPLCHPIALHGVDVDLEVTDDGVRLTATARTADRTGVEMEALTAIAVAGLTVIDMIKSLDPAARITDVQLEAKDGGRSGSWRREDSA